jgi:hypothetical protein
MKEIDFLPKWYKKGRQRQISYRTQYIALGGIFVVMVVWNFVASHSISKAKAELVNAESKQAKAESVSQEFAKIKNEVKRFQKKVNILAEIDSRIDVASVLAEMSFLIDEKIVLNKVELKAERFGDGRKASPKSISAVRVAQGRLDSKAAPLPGPCRFKVVINGVASDSSNVGDLICRLEDSQYFCQVYPSFSRNKNVTAASAVVSRPVSKKGAGRAGENYQVSEFEIVCYLANYLEGSSRGVVQRANDKRAER